MIFKNKGWLSGMAKQVTDLGGYADVVMQGGTLSNELTNITKFKSIMGASLTTKCLVNYQMVIM